MIPTFAAFQTASRALTASQTLLNITGNNIANVDTDGYTRQRVDLTSLSNTSRNQRFANTNKTSTSAGVEAAGVNQIRDAFLDAPLSKREFRQRKVFRSHLRSERPGRRF